MRIQEECRDCKGTGRRRESHRSPSPTYRVQKGKRVGVIPCMTCEGSGVFWKKEKKQGEKESRRKPQGI
jgi:DnaJ-class molecular chaperone